MDFLRRLLGGGQGSGRGADGGMYYYIRSRRSGEIVQVRLDLNQLSPEYENDRVVGYFTHKVVVGQHSFERMDADFRFDPNKRLVDKKVAGGEFVTREEWLAQQQNGLR